MQKGKKILNTVLAVGFFSAIATTAYALPALQLGPGGDSWSWDPTTETWVASDFTSFTVNAYANSSDGNGAYAWDTEGADDQYAYLVFSAVPQSVDDTDVFDITITNASIVDSGYGTPPETDPNSLAPHGIFPTYYEIYEFQFNGGETTIPNTQPGETGSGLGYMEAFDVEIFAPTLTSVHMDLFTLIGDGKYGEVNPHADIVKRFAPFSHDAEAPIPEPATMLLFGTGLAGLAGWRRKRKNPK